MLAGTQLGPYEIGSRLGAGGMGEVYKARDTRLDRTVAIKILPPALASDPQFRQRFDREARAISQLDHPHICALYDVGQQDGIAYLVMQYLEGGTLADRLQSGALPPDQALAFAIQIAEALARAHRAGIVHRDLKPGNIMLTKSGAKLLDFGLAKAAGPAPGVTGLSNLPTTPAGLTMQGTILGTFQYMAPEQIEGGEADIRSDVWAFGCVLYEMLTGVPAFGGKSPASLLAHILTAAPTPARERQPLVTPAVDHILRRCLDKDPEARWQSMADVGHELRWALTVEPPPASVSQRPFWRQPLAYAAALLLVAATATLVLLLPRRASQTVQQPLKLMLPPEGLTVTPFGSAGTPHYALSPDGRHIAFVASAPGRTPSLWVRPLDARVPREIPGSEGAFMPFWSSDSQSIGFFAEGSVKTIGLQGERPSLLGTVIDPSGGAWHGDVILVGRSAGTVLRFSTRGGRSAEATVLRPETGGHRFPQFLPDGRRFIYTESRGDVMLAALDSRAAKPLLEKQGTAVYVDPGFLLFHQRGRLVAQAVDMASLSAMGSPRDVLDHAGYAAGSSYPPASVAAGGLLAFWDGTTVSTDLQWFDRRGNRLPALPAPGQADNFAISPTDGRRVAFSRRHDTGRGQSIWLMEASGNASRFSLTQGAATRPIWSADGQHLLYTSSGDGALVLIRRAVNGAEKEQTVATIPVPAVVGTISGNNYATDWSRDGRTALVSLTQQTTSRDIAVFSVDTGRLDPLFQRPDASEIQARFSPDDRWIAYVSNETGRWEIFVESFPSSGSRWQVSTHGGSQPVWRRDGRELFFLAPDGKLMAVSVTPGETFIHGKPEVLFDTPMRPTYAPYPFSYDVTPDGQRFLIDAVRPGTAPTIQIVSNWFAALGDRK